ncbi:MAG TPA: hypothetical protein VFJ72_15840, partial [Rubrobacteraceae bacterium]|nr:hypothetical protein [Rubrobacteraceae bacterium]
TLRDLGGTSWVVQGTITEAERRVVRVAAAVVRVAVEAVPVVRAVAADATGTVGAAVEVGSARTPISRTGW